MMHIQHDYLNDMEMQNVHLSSTTHHIEISDIIYPIIILSICWLIYNARSSNFSSGLCLAMCFICD